MSIRDIFAEITKCRATVGLMEGEIPAKSRPAIMMAVNNAMVREVALTAAYEAEVVKDMVGVFVAGGYEDLLSFSSLIHDSYGGDVVQVRPNRLYERIARYLAPEIKTGQHIGSMQLIEMFEELEVACIQAGYTGKIQRSSAERDMKFVDFYGLVDYIGGIVKKNCGIGPAVAYTVHEIAQKAFGAKFQGQNGPLPVFVLDASREEEAALKTHFRGTTSIELLENAKETKQSIKEYLIKAKKSYSKT